MTADEFTDLLKQGRVEEARRALKIEWDKAKFSPTSVTVKNGRAVFRHKRKQVVQDAEGNWRLVNPPHGLT